MLDKSLQAELVEILASNFNPNQIDELGSLFEKSYNSHTLLGIKDHITVPIRKAANALVDFCVHKKCDDELVSVLVETDGGKMMGKQVTIPEIEEFLYDLAEFGYVYDYKNRKVRKIKEDVMDLPNWGSLREGKQYDVTIGSIDIVSNSALVSKHGMKKMEKMYFRFWNFLRRLLRVYDGRIWSWAGDGGIMAFTFKGHETRAVQCALEIQALLPVFNTDPDKPIPDDIKVRIGLDTGKIKFTEETGRIVSDTITFAAHLEKQFTSPRGISVSDTVRERLPEKLKGLLCAEDTFEERKVYSICLPELSVE